jgi:hypothetical protein
MMPMITKGRIVYLTLAAPLDGETQIAAIVTQVEATSINARGFAPKGGSDPFFTGVMHRDDVAAMPDGADKNAAMSCTWDWPARG